MNEDDHSNTSQSFESIGHKSAKTKKRLAKNDPKYRCCCGLIHLKTAGWLIFILAAFNLIGFIIEFSINDYPYSIIFFLCAMQSITIFILADGLVIENSTTMIIYFWLSIIEYVVIIPSTLICIEIFIRGIGLQCRSIRAACALFSFGCALTSKAVWFSSVIYQLTKFYQDKEKGSDLPFTFETRHFNLHYFLQLDPQRCGKKFKVFFSTDDDLHNYGDVLMTVTFVNSASENMNGIFISTGNDKTPRAKSISTKWFRKPCLYPLKINLLDGTGNNLSIENIRDLSTEIPLVFEFNLPHSILPTKFITVDGDVDIRNFDSIGLHADVYSNPQYKNQSLTFANLGEWWEYKKKTGPGEVKYNLINLSWHFHNYLWDVTTMPTTQSITRRRYVHDQEKQEHRRGVKVIRVPTDFAKRYLYRLVMTVRALWIRVREGETQVVSIRIKDKYNRMDFAIVQLTFHVMKNYFKEPEYLLKCFTNDSNGVSKMMENVVQTTYYQKKEVEKFPIHTNFVSMVIFRFEKDLPIQLIINNVVYCNFTWLQTTELPHRVVFEPDTNQIAVLSYEWI